MIIIFFGIFLKLLIELGDFFVIFLKDDIWLFWLWWVLKRREVVDFFVELVFYVDELIFLMMFVWFFFFNMVFLFVFCEVIFGVVYFWVLVVRFFVLIWDGVMVDDVELICEMFFLEVLIGVD